MFIFQWNSPQSFGRIEAPSASYFRCRAHASRIDNHRKRVSLFRTGYRPPMNHAAHRCVSGQLVPLRRLSVLIGHGVPPGYPSRMVAEPSWSGIRKPRASIYLWSRIAGVYVEPPLHNHNALFSASVAYRINPSSPPRPISITFYTVRNSVSPPDFCPFYNCFNQWNSI